MDKIIIAIGNLNIGGGQSVVCKLAENINKNKHKVIVVCLGEKKNTSLEEKIESVAEVKYLNIKKGFSFYSFYVFDKAMREISPNVIHAHLGAVQFAAVWSILHRKRIVITAHTTPEKAFSRNTERVVRYGLKKHLVTLVAVSEDNWEKCISYFNIDSSCCKFVNNGVDIHGKVERNRDYPFTFINVATQNENKNQELLINCFGDIVNCYPNSRLLLVGDGSEHDRLIYHSEALGLNSKIVFVGEVSDPNPFYIQSDVYVQSSHREAMPMSILEALGYGLPVISTDVGGIKDVVKGNGLLVKDNDSVAFTSAMLSLLSMSEEAFDQLRLKSLEIVDNFSSGKMASEYEKIYESLF